MSIFLAYVLNGVCLLDDILEPKVQIKMGKAIWKAENKCFEVRY